MLDFLTPTTAGLLMLVGAIPPFGIVYWLRNDRHKPAVGWFQLAMVSGMTWSILFGLIALVDVPVLRFVFTNFLLIAIPSSAICYFLFCYEFTFKKTPPNAAFLLFVPVLLMFVAAWFNPHNLIYTVSDPHLADEILVPANAGSIRPILNVGMSYLLVIMSAGMVLGELMSSPKRSRKIQSFVILLTIVTIAVLAAIKLLDILPPYFDPTPIGWTISGLLFAVSIKRYQFLRGSPAPWDQITNKIQDILIVLDSENVVADANNAARQLLGISSGMTTQELKTQHPGLTGVLAGETTATVEIDIEGRTRIFDTQSSSIESGRGAAGQFIFLRDITDRKDAEKAVQETKERYQRLFQLSPDYVTFVDESGTITDITPAVEHVLGYDPDEIIGTSSFSHIHPDDRDRIADVLAAIVEHPDQDIDVEYRARTKDGSYRWMEARGNNHLTDPLLESVVVSIRDISQRKQREQELSQLTQQLKRKNTQLERLAQIVSHDLQTPLSTAEKLTGLLRGDLKDPDPDIEQSLTDLEATHQRLRGFADHLPRLARESTDVEGPTACELQTVAEAAWNVVDTGPLDLQFESNRTLTADPERLQRVFENLFQNTVTHAVVATASGDTECDLHSTATTVRIGSLPDGFYIEDDGPGIRPEQRDELFEYGMGTGSGSGFGLAIVRTIVEAHGWTVEVAENTPGARFEIYTDD